MEAMYEETELKVIEEVESCYNVVDLPSAKKKRRSRSSTEHAEKPKRPRSGYLLYYFDVHQSLQQEHPDMPQSEINKRISDSWKRLNVADKAYYLERAKMEKDGLDLSIQSAVSSQDVPGFRKIRPRTDYILLPKTSAQEKRPQASVDDCIESGADPLKQDAPQEPLTLGSEVELVEQCVAKDHMVKGTVVSLNRSAALQGVNSSAGRLLMFPHGSHSTILKSEDRCASGTVMPQVKAETTHMVTIIPNHDLVRNKVLPATSPIMMLPLMNRVKPDPKPSFKLSIKYTRRGRGSCSTPGCSFTYVTRHKPPTCPDCGQHLGGKWVPSASKGAGPGSSPSPRKLKGQANNSTLTAASTGEDKAIQGVRNKVDKTVGQTKIQDKRSASPASAPKALPQNEETTGVVTECQPADGASVPNSVGSLCSDSTAVMCGGIVRVVSKHKSIAINQNRRVRAILPAPVTPAISSPSAVVQWIAVPPNKINRDIGVSRIVKHPTEKILALKPSTLKQLGHSVTSSAIVQKSTSLNSSPCVVTDSGVKILSMVPLKQNTGLSLALGLSTARGRGRCKNPSCDYVYKNRHKPPYCPNCGCELSSKTVKKTKVRASSEPDSLLTVLLDPSQPLTPGQRELQRQSTVTLLKHSLQYPENEAELQDVLTLIDSLNHVHSERDTDKVGMKEEDGVSPQNAWPSFYEPTATHCGLCHHLLYRGGEGCSGGQQQCWLLTESVLQPVTLQLKVCLNMQCLALHSFTSLHPGLFNVGNQLLVSLDLFFSIRSQIKQDWDPALAALDIINNAHRPPGYVLSQEELTHVQELLCSGFWAFECLTVRDYNDMICGVCGIAPKLEIAQRSTNSVLQLKNVEFTWPEFQASDEVQVEEFWLAMESEALEQCAFPSNISITRFDASIIAPFFPPLMRSAMVVNTEKDKITTDMPHTGDVSMLVRLIHNGQLRPDQMYQHTEEELRFILEQCGVPAAPDSSKDELMVSVCLLYTHVQNGFSTASQPPQHLTAGKLSKLCPHQVVCGSKYLVRGETARDHVDLLVSSRFWPPVYVADCAQKVALCAEALYPELAAQMWGRNQGCFSDITAAPEYVSCPELQDQQYSIDLSTVHSNSHLHPQTKSASRYIVHPGDPSPPTASDRHRSMMLCKELQPHSGHVSSICSSSGANDSEEEDDRRTLVFNNAAHYYLYSRLVDFLSSRDVVSQQMADVLGECQQGEVVMIRDTLYRLGVAQLNREEEQEGCREEGEADTDAVAADDMALE
ncbi:HMG domain-containing protein 3 [Trichomycterus rosablanca]|uniref:HMG domain-containing protein 3 n=1 Tax=Trichomycterus rosablanca TaxID=2290929 RepID=UPI002F35BAC9